MGQLFIHLFISVWTYGYLFCTLSYNLVVCYLFCRPRLARFGIGALSVGPMSLTLSSVLLLLTITLLSGKTECYRRILYILCPSAKTSHFFRSPGFFQWRIVLEKTKIWALGMLFVVLLLLFIVF